ncbi:hypothetical protein M0R45_000048 [Rubus argutus]|uniref:Uncharacterized protein n=1 Tax=Rubus argutus TaxID=59490 RepID=A0AAW1VNI6_RUBAR
MEPIDDDPFEPSSKQRMLRSYSDPYCPSSSSFGREMLVKNSEAKSSLVRTPSLPLPVGERRESSASSETEYSEEKKGGENQESVLLRHKGMTQLQGFKDLGFTFDQKDIAPSVISILPGLQEKNRDEGLNPDMVRRPYLSEAWLVQSCAPPPPNLAASRSAEDMKAQIKFWARAVASNVR